MRSIIRLVTTTVLFVTNPLIHGFSPQPKGSTTRSSLITFQTTIKDVMDGAKGFVQGAVEEVENAFERDKLKRTILQLGASYDRGFGASPSVRSKVDAVISDLEFLNQETNASRCISGPALVEIEYNTTGNSTTVIESQAKKSTREESSPLKGNWRMIWTTAPDVLVLGANPFVTVGAIYQIFDPPVVTNVIDLLPRIQNLIPPSLVQGSLLRAQVKTKASPCSDPMKIVLNFESVRLEPMELLGQKVDTVLPPLGFDLPKLFDTKEDEAFQVSFLDDDMLIIRQRRGGLFVLARVEDIDP